MYKVKVCNGLERPTLILDGDVTVRQAFEQANVNIGRAMVNVNGIIVNDIDQPIGNFNLKENDINTISAVVKQDNAR